MENETFRKLNIGAPFHLKRTDGFGSGWSNINKGGQRGPVGGHHDERSLKELEVEDLAKYPLPAISMPRAGSPTGAVTVHKDWTSSTVYPGTSRTLWLYVPSQYDGTADANLIVLTDGFQQAAATTLDNLIADRLIPLTIAVFVSPGIRLDGMLPDGDGPDPFIVKSPKSGRSVFQDAQRSFEYDSLTERFSEFLARDLLPMVEGSHRISQDPARRAIQGASSGAVAAFMAAWYRPDLFGCVVSWIGSFVNIRGAHELAWVIRNTPRKSFRIYLQSGERDLNNSHGSWPLANKTISAALEYAGYEFRFEFGTAGHNSLHGMSTFGETLRWLFGPGPRAKL